MGPAGRGSARLGLVDELTALENIGLPLRWQAGTAPANQVDELCRVLGLEDVADRLPAQMSLGQQQRVAIARALVLQPAMIALDEPTAHQDESSADAVAAALRAAALAGTCCLIATHAPDLLARVDRTITLTDGRVASATD